MAVVLLTLPPNADVGKLPVTVSFGDTAVNPKTVVALLVFV